MSWETEHVGWIEQAGVLMEKGDRAASQVMIDPEQKSAMQGRARE